MDSLIKKAKETHASKKTPSIHNGIQRLARQRGRGMSSKLVEGGKKKVKKTKRSEKKRGGKHSLSRAPGSYSRPCFVLLVKTKGNKKKASQKRKTRQKERAPILTGRRPRQESMKKNPRARRQANEGKKTSTHARRVIEEYICNEEACLKGEKEIARMTSLMGRERK